MISTIIPSLIKYFGALDNPWDDDQFAAIFSSLLKKVHPVRASSIVKGDKEWRYVSVVFVLRCVHTLTCLQARQGVYDWRSNFGKLAIRLVTKTAKALGSPTAISVWANNALARGGEATYSHPDVQHPKDARGALHTKLHIQLLASHYSVAEGAIIETSYPVGALSLANVAIRRAFTAFKSGTFIAQDGFTGNKYGDATMQTRKGSVKGLEGIPHRFDGLVAMAMAELPSFKRAEAENVEQAANDEDAYAAVDPPTSPPAADQY
ncbi:hypothetical protein K466DRAFT_505487 [Polyporus arcularius HHB13444]|uniref:Uncharacterized protein n=1 Tax=Polyporus arcularius HHB13444 TaxID=1314778 RepID=A0A5C3NQE2_9APHY|nr:hypothetical protein K466DRAFT_505487 [Polyporus arcularius HHB13444]